MAQVDLGVLLLTGTMAAGKSTVAAALADRLPRSAHVRGDVFRRFVTTGRADPSPAMTDEEWRQLRLRYRLATQAADGYAAAGFATVYQDVVVGPVLAEVVAMISTRPRHVVVLDPEPAVVAARDRDRTKTGYADGWDPADFVRALRQETPRLGLWLDTSELDVGQTVDAIIDRLDEARVAESGSPSPPPSGTVTG